MAHHVAVSYRRKMTRRSRPAGAALLSLLALLALSVACTSESEPESPTADPSISVSTTTDPPAPDEADSSQDLIAGDLESGEIDLGTSLQLRAWALFADPRLPERYDGSGSSGHDETLHEDIAASLDSLQADQRGELERYLLRPSDPDSPFSAPPALRVASTDDESQRCSAPRQWFSQDWPDDSADAGFRVWACGSSRATVNSDLAKVVAVGSRLWGPMTSAVPNGMGRPVPDTDAKQSDGNGKVDVYLVEPLAECRDRGDACKEIPGDAVAIAPKDRPLNCSVDGFPARGCSGYMVVGRGRLGTPAFAADFAHEFFHLLQLAHNGQIDLTWYHEASAVWAEWFYEREAATPEAYDLFEAYQKENRSLLWYDHDRLMQYRAWNWPLFQFTERGSSSVFAAWQAIEGATTRADVDKAVDDQLSFADAFGDFAVRNAQPAAYIPPASTGLEDDRWQSHPALGDFPTDPHLVTSARSAVTLGEARHAADIDPLTAQYDEYEVVDDDVRQVVIDIRKLTGAGHADLDVLARVGGGDTWRRFPGRGGKVTLCRDTPAEDVSFFQVVVSNHSFARNGDLPDFSQGVKGDYTIEAEDECDPRERYLAGSITWDATKADTFWTTTVSGRLELVLHDKGGGLWVAERGEGSTYSYKVVVSNCTPDGHLSGVVESGVGGYEPEWHIANAIVLQTDLTDAADLQMDIYFYDKWDVTCTLDGQSYPDTKSAAGIFPGCDDFATVIAENNGTGHYTIDCDIDVPDSTWSGHVAGELHPIEGPPSPDG
jgi:hypothetical protein